MSLSENFEQHEEQAFVAKSIATAVAIILIKNYHSRLITVLLISALSVSGAIFIVLDMTHPMQGMVKISSAPMRNALEHLGR